jgi:hypothetical protein
MKRPPGSSSEPSVAPARRPMTCRLGLTAKKNCRDGLLIGTRGLAM